MLPLIRPLLSPSAQRFLDFWLSRSPVLDMTGYQQRLASRAGIARAWSQFSDEYPIVLGPVCTQPPFAVGSDIASADAVAELLHHMRLVVVVNALALPAAAVPAGVANGLPQGVQLISDRFREDLCLTAAQAIEDRLGVLTPIGPVGGSD